MPTLPTFLLIGAPRCGTTSIYHYLNQHPQVFMSRMKEPHFFTFDGSDQTFDDANEAAFARNKIRDLASYQRLFAGRTDELAVGEASPGYLHWPGAHERIRRRLPGVKLLAILRQPVERAFSEHVRRRHVGKETRSSFEEAFRDDILAVVGSRSWSGNYRSNGYYHEQLTRYYALFPREQLRVYLFEDLCEDPGGLLQDLFTFLGVDAGFVPDVSKKHNATGAIANPLLRLLWNRTYVLRSYMAPFVPIPVRGYVSNFVDSRKKTRSHARLSPELRRELTAYYRDDIGKLGELIGRDLSRWL
ncbi:sulfotransferase [Planctomycetota bacterium]